MSRSLTVSLTSRTQLGRTNKSESFTTFRAADDASFAASNGSAGEYCYYFADSGGRYNCIQPGLYFDLSALPAGAIITGAQLTLATGTHIDTIWNSVDVTGNKAIRWVGPGNASSSWVVGDYRDLDAGASALFDLATYSSIAGTYDATATGLAHIQNWLESDSAVKFVGQPDPCAAGIDYVVTGAGAATGFESEGIDDADLILTYYIPGEIAALGCNF